MADYYTIQLCKVCGKQVKIDALNFLLNLDKSVLCEEHQQVTTIELPVISKEEEE